MGSLVMDLDHDDEDDDDDSYSNKIIKKTNYLSIQKLRQTFQK